MSAEKILVISDDSDALKMIKAELPPPAYDLLVVSNENQAVEACGNETFDACIVDLGLGQVNGVFPTTKIHCIDPELPVLILSAHASVDKAVKAIKKEGAYTYIVKPFDTGELLLQVQRALENRRLNCELQRLRSLLRGKYHVNNIVAKSEKMKGVLDLVSRVATTQSTIYLHGESGTGKEVIAKAIHLASERRDKPFVAVNCAALPEPLLESELFGHEKGAFTGADRRTRGLFMQAHQGTILLDEIGDMPFSIQAKLLRALQERQFYPVGSDKPVAADVRIIAATNKDLIEQVEKGLFRRDLFYRLYIIPIQLPPLRERKEDIFPLAYHFLNKVSHQMRKKVRGFTPEALQKLMLYDWPGNIRELENTIECAVAMTRQDMIPAEILLHSKFYRQAQDGTETYAQNTEFDKGIKSYKEARYQFERAYLLHLLELSRGKASEAAKLAEKSRTDFYELLKRHEIKIDEFKRSQ
jgi:two-component system, NtrC family, response regulator GlrR